MSRKGKVIKFLLIFLTFCFIIGGIGLSVVVAYYSFDLPDIEKLRNYEYQLTTRLYSEDGILLKEYAEERRIFVGLKKIPDIVKNAFISAEDKNFYRHKGIDAEAIISANIRNIKAYFEKKQFHGGSTITQQVVKNILLTSERTLARKIKEAILSYKVTKSFTKDEILEIYLNYVFLGNNSYGVAAAALNYFNKNLDDLTIDEAAVLASLPKAPTKLNPALNKDKAIERRNYVIRRMFEDRHITEEEYKRAIAQDLILYPKDKVDYFNAGAFTEDTRKKLLALYDEESLLKKGLTVSTTIKPKMQIVLDKYLKLGLEEYDRRHGYRGALGNIFINNETDFDDNWSAKLKNFVVEQEYRAEWQKAVLLSFDEINNKINIGLIKDSDDIDLRDDEELSIVDGIVVIKSNIGIDKLKWVIAPELLPSSNNVEDVLDENGEIIGDFEVRIITDINLTRGSVIFVERIKDTYELRQIPIVNGGAVALDPHTGRVFAMVGGYIDSEINFNRVTQANRQVGSAIKPFVYLTAFEQGYNGTNRIMDEEIVLPQGEGIAPYKPKNITNTYYGLVTLRKALQSSYNVSTVRLASQIGLNNIANTIKRFGINKQPKRVYSMVLGSLETKLIDIVNAYGMIINGGKFIQRETIEKIQDSTGKTIYKRDIRDCIRCNVSDDSTPIDYIEVPFIEDNRKIVTDTATAYQITSIMEGVVKYGTAARARSIGRIIGAKTGTSSEFRDAWFIGFSPDLVLGIFIGFDNNTTLGKNETGSKAAAPIFVSMMKELLEDQPSVPFRVPESITLKRIDITTGKSPTLISRENDIIFEAFKKNELKSDFEEKSNDYSNEGEDSDWDDDEDIFKMKDKLEKLQKGKQMWNEGGEEGFSDSVFSDDEREDEEGDIFGSDTNSLNKEDNNPEAGIQDLVF
ncbi:MAG: PBP1A family penicillin-binding protein [Rickettsiales bacterium]|jgi:penicillin-binding protein 1A|nr:PBP1A family penicillin-binding protein [Rickettsiales bacterium]